MQVSINEELFTWPSDDPHLIASQCIECETVNFPASPSCPACCGASVEKIKLATRGTLWSWTVQNFPPKSPPYIGDDLDENFQGYGVGYIELPNQLRVESRLSVADPAKLEIGMEMELRIVPFTTNKDGQEIMNYVFAPATRGKPR
jgi:uncharacterized OB-fold protein